MGALLKELNWYQVDFQEHHGHEGRRLVEARTWTAEWLDVEWPNGKFFRPEGLFCSPDGNITIASTSAFYNAVPTEEPQVMRMRHAPQQVPWHLKTLRRLRLAPGMVEVCWPDAHRPADCLLVSPSEGSLSIWSQDSRLDGDVSSSRPPFTLPLDSGMIGGWLLAR